MPEESSTLRRPSLAILASLLVGVGLSLLAGANPLTALANLVEAGFGCRAPGAYCALLTALTFALPLLLGGLAVTVALRAGFFSLGVPGQMLWGAALATAIGAVWPLPAGLHPALALAGGALAGAVWAWIAAVLRERLGVNEILVTLLLNPVALVVVGLLPLGPLLPTARLLPLIPGTKVTLGLLLGALAALGVFLLLWRTAWGLEQRMAGQAPRFALFGGIPPARPILRAVIISGALAGLAGAHEVLGVHYGFVSAYTGGDNYDSLVVAFLGQLHPLGVVIAAVLLGGLRAGALIGLQIESGVPRELAGILIAVMLIASSAGWPARPNAGVAADGGRA